MFANLRDQFEMKAKLAVLEAKRTLLEQVQTGRINVKDMLLKTKGDVRGVRQVLNISPEESLEDEDEDYDDGESSGDDDRIDGAGASGSGSSPQN